MKVLIVEDEKMIRELLAAYFAITGHDVLTAENGKEAMRKIPLVDLIISDVDMPKMNGLELIAWVREKRDIPIILMSGRPEPKEHQANAFIEKPFNFLKLGHLIEKLTK
jgi:CheY-like chemotaxis protein